MVLKGFSFSRNCLGHCCTINNPFRLAFARNWANFLILAITTSGGLLWFVLGLNFGIMPSYILPHVGHGSVEGNLVKAMNQCRLEIMKKLIEP